EKCFGLYLPGQIAPEDSRKQFDGSLNQSFRPPRLLAFERIHFDRKFGGANDVRQIQKLPSRHLCAVAEIGIFRQRIVLPSTGALDRISPPDARSPVEIEESPGEMTSAVFDDEVPVEDHRLDLRQQ